MNAATTWAPTLREAVRASRARQSASRRPLLAAFPGWTTPAIEVLERIEKNSVENEPYAVAVIAAAGSIGAISSPVAITALNVFTITRYIHSAIMCYGVADSFKQSVQTGAFLPSAAIPLIVAGLVIKKIHF